jgi:hypothetical protein
MKRGILVATLMMTAAGVASANLLTTAPQGVASPWPLGQRATEATPPVAKSNADKSSIDRTPTDKIGGQAAPTVNTAPKLASAQTTQKALVEPQQAPVPFRMKPRPPVNLPPAVDKATEAKAADKPGETSSDPAAGDATGESAARAAIEADGYKGVKVLRKGANGVWHASALRGKTTVMLTVDASGSVSAD